MVRANTLVVALFDAVDANHDGKIDEEEGRRFFADIGTHLDDVGYFWEDLAKCSSSGNGMVTKKGNHTETIDRQHWLRANCFRCCLVQTSCSTCSGTPPYWRTVR